MGLIIKILFLMVFMAASAVAQDREVMLRNLTQSTLDWVDRSCPPSLGESIQAKCILRETPAALRGKPDLSHLKPKFQDWIVRTCPDSMGPTLTINCLNRESAALQTGLPLMPTLSEQQKRQIDSSCSTSLGPSLFFQCVQREAAALFKNQPVPQQFRAEALSAPRQRNSLPRSSSSVSYEIEVAHDDEFFIINGEKFKSQTYCFGWEESDEILFLDGSPYGACVSATLFNLRTREKCDVWCE